MPNISQELYNSIANTTTPEELWQLKELILYKDDNDISNENLVFVRILSVKEYDKYIINGTCNGSIIKANKQVWNVLIDYIIFLCWSSSSYVYGYNNIGIANMMKDLIIKWHNFDVAPYTNVSEKCMGDMFVDSQQTLFSYPEELVSDNNLEKCYTTKNCKYALCIGCLDIHSAAYYGRNKGPETVSLTQTPLFSKNSFLNERIATSVDPYNRANRNFTLRCNTNFRPVFQYKDNNKSLNIYY